jgi:hypothetical protein
MKQTQDEITQMLRLHEPGPINSPPPGGIETFHLWGPEPDRAFIRKIAKLNTKSPSTGEGV